MVNFNELTKEMKEELAFSKEELAELARAKAMPEMAVKFRRVNPPRIPPDTAL